MTLGAVGLPTGLGYTYDLFGVPISVYSVGRYTANDRWSYAGVAGAIAVSATSTLVAGGEPAADIGGAFVVLFLVWNIGRRLRIRSQYLALLQERAAHNKREQEAEARRALATERTRIARELHDVVAHQVSVMTVQAGAAKTIVADDPERACTR